jgi:hypothetical protein
MIRISFIVLLSTCLYWYIRSLLYTAYIIKLCHPSKFTFYLNYLDHDYICNYWHIRVKACQFIFISQSFFLPSYGLLDHFFTYLCIFSFLTALGFEFRASCLLGHEPFYQPTYIVFLRIYFHSSFSGCPRHSLYIHSFLQSPFYLFEWSIRTYSLLCAFVLPIIL